MSCLEMRARPSRATQLEVSVRPSEDLAYVQRLMRPIVDRWISWMGYFFGGVAQASQPLLSQLWGRLEHRL